MLESTLENCQSNTYYDVDASQRCTYNREKDTSSLSEQGGKSSIGYIWSVFAFPPALFFTATRTKSVAGIYIYLPLPPTADAAVKSETLDRDTKEEYSRTMALRAVVSLES
eukprot:scaffold24064_cov137-Skeletonema_menzelii.AAC.4